MAILWESNVSYLNIGKSEIPIEKTDTNAAKITVTFSGTTEKSKPRYPNKAIRGKEEDGGDFYATTQTLTWAEGESDTKYAVIDVFKQDDDRELFIAGKIKIKEGDSELDEEGFVTTLFIVPENVKDLDEYVADEFEDANVTIFSQKRAKKDVRLVVLDGRNPFGAGITIKRQNSSVSELGNAAHISVDAEFQVNRLPRNPRMELRLPVTNGGAPVVLSSFIEQKWTLTEPDNINAEPKDVSQPGDKIVSDNLILPANSNVVRVPLEISSKWLSADKALIFHYPLDEIKSEGDNQFIEEKIANRNGIFVQEEIPDDTERVTSVVEIDGKSAIDFNRQFHFHVTSPNFITPDIQEFSISLWYHQATRNTSYNHFCEGLYTNNSHFVYLDLMGSSGNHYVMLGGYGRNVDAHYFSHNEMDRNGTGWFLYTWTRNTKTGINKYYVNGKLIEVLKDRLYPISQPGKQAKELFIGKRGKSYFDGNVLDFKGYNKELTQDEVMALYKLDSDTTFKIGGNIKINLSGVATR